MVSLWGQTGHTGTEVWAGWCVSQSRKSWRGRGYGCPTGVGACQGLGTEWPQRCRASFSEGTCATAPGYQLYQKSVSLQLELWHLPVLSP